MKMIGSGTCNRLSPQTHDEERDEEGPRYSLEPSQTLEFERFYRFPMPLTTKSCSWACSLTDKTLVSSFKLPIFASITVFLFFIVNQLIDTSNLRRKFELLLFSTLFIGGRKL